MRAPARVDFSDEVAGREPGAAGTAPPQTSGWGDVGPRPASRPAIALLGLAGEQAPQPTSCRVQLVAQHVIMDDAHLSSTYAPATKLVRSRHMAVNSSSPAVRLPDPEPSFPGAAVLDRFETASHELIKGRALLQRTDSKYFGRADHLDAILESLVGRYAVIRVASGCAADYRSSYFDTPDLRCYHDHLRGRRLRQKVRIRHYADRKLTFLELKAKQNLAVTDKHRLDLPYGTSELTVAGREFLARHCPLPVDQLELTVENSFRRISLIGLDVEERVTIDLDIAFRYRGRELAMPGLVVLEVKQHPYNPRSPMMNALHKVRMRERSLSKYTTAIAEMAPVRKNRLLPLLRTLHRTIA